MGETCVICKQDMGQVTPLHVKHKHDMTWEEYQKAKTDPTFLMQVEKAATEREKKTEMENYARQILLNYWFSPQLFSTVIKNFRDHATKDRSMFNTPKLDLKKYDKLEVVKTGSVHEAEALEKTGKWKTVSVSGGVDENEDENGVVKVVRRPKVYELHRREVKQ